MVTSTNTINGKLTVDTIEVSDSLTIGGAKPLGQDAIDKLQAQIIAPTQSIYVSNNGSDETGTGTSLNPVKTLDKAQELIKTNVSDINIYLDNTDDDVEYTFTVQPFVSKSNVSLTIRAKDYWGAAENNTKKPILKPILYKEPTTANNQFRIGYYICMNFTSIHLQNLRIEYPTEAVINTKYYNKYLISQVSALIIDRCIIDLIQNSVIMNAISSITNTFKINQATINGTEDNSCYLTSVGRINVTVDLTEPDNMEKWSSWGSSEIGVFSFLTQVGSHINNVNKLSSSCVALYSNIT